MIPERHVWIFNGTGGPFPGAVFTDLIAAKKWIRANKLTGVLTAYPLDEGCMDWAIRTRAFKVENPNNLAKSRDPKIHWQLLVGRPGTQPLGKWPLRHE